METTTLAIIVLLTIVSFTQAADLTVKCIVSENTAINDAIFKVKKSLSSGTFSLQETGGYVTLRNSKRGVLRLIKSLKLLALREDNTRRLNVVLVVTSSSNDVTNVNIEFIVLKDGFGDAVVKDIFTGIKLLVKDDNIVRPVSAKYPIYKLLHSFLMNVTRRSSVTSRASCTFQRAVIALIKKILTNLGVSSAQAVVHIGPEGLLSVEKLEEILEESGCIEAIPTPVCPDPPSEFRTIDGTCNNAEKPTAGAAEIGFTRFVPPRYFDAEGLNDALGAGDQPNAPDLPNPSEVVSSDYIIEQPSARQNRDGILHMFMQWGQFIDHDMTLAPESRGGEECENIPCDGSPADFEDPCFALLPAGGRGCIRFIRSAAVCPGEGDELEPREQINVNTGYVDASMVYGSSKEIEDQVRNLTNDYGLLRVQSTSQGDLLPLDVSELEGVNALCTDLGGCFLAGDGRSNEQASLAAIHTLFVREHNRIAKELKILNGHWTGERIFQVTRRIVGAIVQKITYEDWLPIAIGKNTLSRYRNYKDDVDPGISNAFATAAFRMGHSLIRPTFDCVNANFDPIVDPIPLKQMFFNNTLIQKIGVDCLLLGTIGNDSQEMDNELAIGLTQQLFERETTSTTTGRVGLDLAALNIQRGRDHGLPGYGSFLRRCVELYPDLYPKGFNPNPKTFDDLASLITDTTVRNSLSNVYNDDPENVDLWPAGLAETEIGTTQLGPTFTCLFRDQFERLRDGDRFFYLNSRGRGGVFTSRQRRQIRRASLSRILCDNVRGIVSAPEDAFKRCYRRVCDSIPQVDLRAWREPVTTCKPNPCKNNGKCRKRNTRTSVECACPSGFTGSRFCDKN